MADGVFSQLDQCCHGQCDAFKGGSSDMAPIAVPGESNKHSPGLGIPVGCSPTREGWDKHDAAGISNLKRQIVHLISMIDDLHGVSQPLDHCSSVEETSLKAIGGIALVVGPAQGAE